MFSALYATVRKDDALPSIFELLFAARMRESFKPAFNQLVFIIWKRLPTLLTPVMRWKAESFALLMFFVERYSLRRNSASVSESFYGLQRQRAIKVGTPHIAGPDVNKFGSRHVAYESKRDEAVSLFCLVVLPYLWTKVGDACQSLAEPTFSSTTTTTTTANTDSDEFSAATLWKHLLHGEVTKVIKILREWITRHGKPMVIALYPLLDSLFKLLSLVFQMRYLLEQTEFASPMLRASGLVLVRRPPPAPAAAAVTPDGTLTKIAKTSAYGATIARLVFVGSLVALKVFEWLSTNAENTPTAQTITSESDATAIRPPQPVGNAKSTSACPICGQDPIVNPAATFTGYVFCYACIAPYVATNQKCPVTKLPCNESQIRKIQS